MKALRLTGLFMIAACLSAAQAYCQDEVKRKVLVGGHVSPLFWGGAIVMNIGFDYEKQLSNRWYFCYGFEQMIGFENGRMDIGYTSVPLLFKGYFNKHFYFKAGTPLDFYLGEVSAQAGIGLTLGFGYENEFSNGLTISVNPYLRGYHALVLYPPIGFFPLPSLEVSLGVGYRF